MPQFAPGETKVVIATVKVQPEGIACESELWLGDGAKAATSGLIPFASTGALQEIRHSLIMPASGTFYPNLVVYANGKPVLVYRHPEFVSVALFPNAVQTWSVAIYDSQAGFKLPDSALDEAISWITAHTPLKVQMQKVYFGSPSSYSTKSYSGKNFVNLADIKEWNLTPEGQFLFTFWISPDGVGSKVASYADWVAEGFSFITMPYGEYGAKGQITLNLVNSMPGAHAWNIAYTSGGSVPWTFTGWTYSPNISIPYDGYTYLVVYQALVGQVVVQSEVLGPFWAKNGQVYQIDAQTGEGLPPYERGHIWWGDKPLGGFNNGVAAYIIWEWINALKMWLNTIGLSIKSVEPYDIFVGETPGDPNFKANVEQLWLPQFTTEMWNQIIIGG